MDRVTIPLWFGDGDRMVVRRETVMKNQPVVYNLRVRTTPSILKGEEDLKKWKADVIREDGSLANWPPVAGRIFDSAELFIGYIEMLGWEVIRIHRASDKPPVDVIPCPPDKDPRHLIELIAYDLINRGTSNDDRRAGRRLLGALEALWAEDGADLSDPQGENTVVA